jgi:arylsulfatase A-like enzyme
MPFLFILLLFAALAHSEIKPNVVIIYADDLGYGDISAYGATKIQTPNIDKLAENGRSFMNAHSPSSVCTPSRYSLLTGEYPRHLGGPLLHGPLIIPDSKETMPKMFQRAGYKTAIIGKWHLGFQQGVNKTNWNQPLTPGPTTSGFDYYFGVPVVNSAPPFFYVENTSVVGAVASDPFVYGVPAPTDPIYGKQGLTGSNSIGGGQAAHDLYVDSLVGLTLMDKTNEWIRDNHQNPFFVYFAATNIHHPFTPHRQFIGTSDAGLYGDFVHELDHIVGEVVKNLDSLGVLDNTIVVFTSDNGGMANPTGVKALINGHLINGPYLGAKFGVFEGSTRVPTIVQWPRLIPAGTQSDLLFSQVDLYSTFAHIIEEPLLEGEAHDSYNMLEALITKEEKPEPIRDFLVLFGAGSGGRCPTLKTNKWIYTPTQITKCGFADYHIFDPGDISLFDDYSWHRDGVWYNYFASWFTLGNFSNNGVNADGTLKAGTPTRQLYDIKLDPYQSNNAVAMYPTVADSLAALLTQQRNSTTNVTRPEYQAVNMDSILEANPMPEPTNIVAQTANNGVSISYNKLGSTQFIHLELEGDQGILTVNLVDLQGKVVRSLQSQSQGGGVYRIPVDVSALSGIYFINIDLRNERIVRKIFI